MSTAAAPERSHAPYAEPDEYIDYQLRKTQTGIKRIDMLTAGIVAITVLIGYVLLFVLSDHWLFEGGVGGTARMLMFLPVIGFVGWLIGAKVIWPAMKNVSGLYAAKTLETSSAEFRSSLLNLVDLKQAGREVSPLIMATIEKRAAVTLAKFNVDDAIDKRPLLRTLYVLFGIVVAFCAYSILSPKKLGPSVLRAIVPFTNVTPATQTEILEVKPGDARLRAGGILPVSVQLRGEVPADVTLLFTTADRRFVDEAVQLGATTDPNIFEGTLGNDEHGLLQSFSYYVVAGDARSPEYRVEIITPPSATVTEVRYDYPEYTELDPRTQMGGAIDVWERTAITISAATNVPVKRAEFELADTEDFSSAYPGSSVKIADGKKLTIAWRADPRQADGKFPKFYRIKVWHAEDTPDPKPAVYPINVRIDQPPQVVLIDPTTNLELPANGTVPLVVAARDQDFKLRTVSLKIARDENDITDETLFDGSQQEVALKHDFQLEPLRLKAGDKIRIWVEAQDNRLPTHNLAKTPPIEITIKGKVTKEEAKKQLDEQKQEQQQRLDEANKKNNDQANDPNEPPPSDPASSPDQPPRDPKEPEQPKDKDDEAKKDQPQQNGQQQDDKDSKGKDGGSGKTQKGGEGKKTETGSEGKSDKPGEKGNAADGKQSLKNDGTQDQEALERIAQNEKRHGRLPKKSEPQSSSSEKREPQENSNGESADKPMPNGSSKPNPQDDPKANDSSKPPQPNRGQQPKADKNDNADPGDKPNANEKGTDTKNGNDPKNAEGSKEPKGKSPKEGDEPKPGDNDPKKPNGDGQKSDPKNDPKSTNKPNGKEGDDKNADGGNKPMPKNGPGEKNDPSASEDKAGGEKPGSKPDAQKPAPMDKPGNDPKQSQPDGSGKPDSQKPKGLGKPETDDKQRSPDGAKSDKPSSDSKSSNPKDDKAGSDKPDPKKPNDPAGKGAGDKDSKSPDKQAGSNKSEDSKPGDKGAEKADSSKKPQRGQQGDKSKDPSNDKGDDNKSSSDKSGDDKPGQPKDGNKNDSGQSKKEGSPKSDKGGQKPGGKEGQPKSASKQGGGESSDSDSDPKGSAKPGSQGNKKGKAGSAPGGGSANQPGDPSASNDPSGSGSSSGAPEAANEEFTKEAANLVLKRLQKDIERGEVDQELLDELGWNEEQMKKFVERMQQQLEAKPDDDSPQTKARQRQFEEMLKNLNLTEKTQRRYDTNKDKQTGDGIGPVRRPPPPEYRESFESYTKSLSKKKAAETPKK